MVMIFKIQQLLNHSHISLMVDSDVSNGYLRKKIQKQIINGIQLGKKLNTIMVDHSI